MQDSRGLLRGTSMDPLDHGIAAMRRGSCDDATASLHPHLRHLAERRRSAPSLVFEKALGIQWSPIREEVPRCVSVEQSPFVLGLTSENGELLLDECVQVTEGTKTRKRHLFLFSNVIVFTKLKSTTSYRLKHRVNLEDVWLYSFEDELHQEGGTMGDIDLRLTLILAWDVTFCLVCFRWPDVKDRWLDTLQRKIKGAKARAGCASSSPDVLMKVLSGSVATKTLTRGGMEQMIQVPLDGDAKISAVSKHFNNQEDRLTQPTETKWSLVRRLGKGSSFISKTCRTETNTKTQLFGQPLFKICPGDCSLPKPVTDLLMLLRRRGPSTEGVFRKPCSSKHMKDIREQLNSGMEVDLDSQPVVLLVGLLKSFLKELPGSLLVSELYDKWMMALDNEDTQQRALEIINVLDHLPGPNKLLLRYLMCVLHHILENADINKMDAYNLAVCIGPTLLQLDDTRLDEQKEKMKKATELTQYLIENCEILGGNIPSLLDTDEDSLSSQHHDSAYDSTDPDGDGEAGEKIRSTLEEHGSSSSSFSFSPSTATSSWPSEAIFNTKPEFNRRCSEPIILLSADRQSLCSHARSHDDCSVERKNFDEQPLKKQISDDSFLLRGRGGAKSVLSFPRMSSSSNMDPLPYMGKNCSSSSLESAASNQSEGSVFTSSPLESPRCHRRANATNQISVAAKAQQDIARPISDERKRSQSMRVAPKVLMRTRSLGAFSRSSQKKNSQKENSFPCATLQEDSRIEEDASADLLHRSRPLSAIEVFKQMDSRLPCRPPSYEQAVQNVGDLPQYQSMTVQDALNLERRSRPSSVNYDFPSTFPVSQYMHNEDCFAQSVQDKADVVKQRQPFRQRAMSECVSAGHHEVMSRRCSQPVFEEFNYAKESYV
ncbi:T cell activation RhoGTPase activating protein b isoform X1 [Amphiprion ocellaris]|uniref:Rho-GAP domain-containing protein n=2 Tax=Amphiprion ocellaris TaxID=80972 RepID=A0AAQ5ZUJ9_AMPOC|nr:T cell activation RhoGTPase activating protein b isoform X1 [Amphiprion ocellaris]